jgi:hypothetical protein
VLLPEDDYPIHQVAAPLAHVMGGHPNAYDRFWFNGYTEEHYFAAALGLYPNRGVIDAAFSFSAGGRQRSVFAGDRLRGRPTEVGPIRVEILEPLRVNRLVVDAPDQELAAELVYTARTEPFEEARQSMFDGPRIFMDVSRATQLGTWTGWIDTPEGRVVVEPGTYGTKDRSWGVRPVGEALPGAPGERAPQLCFLWAPLNFPDGAVHFMSFDDTEGRPVSRSAVDLPLAGAGTPRRREGVLVLAPQPGTRRAAGATLVIDGETIALTPVATFLMRGAGYGHPTYAHGRWHGGAYVDGELLELDALDPVDFHNVHVQQVVRAVRHGHEGLGVLESLIVGPYEPAGLTGLLDPFGPPGHTGTR